MRTSCILLVLIAIGAGCASAKPAGRPDEWRARLARAMGQEVESRDKRDELSRLLIDAVDAGAVEGLSLAQLESAFGPGTPCAGYALCEQQGFSRDDWYYLIGRSEAPAIKQLPVLIIGFTSHGYVGRVFTLKTH